MFFDQSLYNITDKSLTVQFSEKCFCGIEVPRIYTQRKIQQTSSPMQSLVQFSLIL